VPGKGARSIDFNVRHERSSPAWSSYGCRRTSVEVTVNHIGGTRSGVAGTYNRSELMDERKEALERWATHVAGIVAPLPENVVSLPRKRRRK
jgi:hypothetical protein